MISNKLQPQIKIEQAMAIMHLSIVPPHHMGTRMGAGDSVGDSGGDVRPDVPAGRVFGWGTRW